MFKIDKSSVEYMDSNKSFIVIKPAFMQDAYFSGENAPGAPYSAASPATSAPSKAAVDPASLLADAQTEAARILLDASKQAEQIRIDAYQTGYAQGQEEALRGLEEARREYEQAFAHMAAQVNDHLQEVDAALEQNILRLSLSIAKKIINIQLEKNDIVFEQLLRRTIGLHQSGNRFAIRLNPREYQRFFAQGGEQLRSALQCPPFTVIADATVAQGGLVLESDDGIYRTGIDAQLEKLSAALGVSGDDNA